MHHTNSPATTDTIDTSNSRAIVIYHANCFDGFGAAWAFHTLKEKDYATVDYIEKAYGQGVEDILTSIVTNNDRPDCYIVDFSFSRDILVSLSNVCRMVWVLDHHKTAQEALVDWKEQPTNVTIDFDMKQSGAGLVWRAFCSFDQEYNALIFHIEDRDLWKFTNPDTKAVMAYVSLQEKDFDVWTAISNQLTNDFGYRDIVRTGQSLNAQHQKFCEEIAAEAQLVTILDEHGNKFQGYASNCPPQFASEVGNILAKRIGTYGATYCTTSKGSEKWSLRSEGSYDVSVLAKTFGGGGHRNAAGFTISEDYSYSDPEGRLWDWLKPE